ncbi:unnamed protein product [Lupinus luteus]|uniref:H15 domain-containing protein n=1 Tax=Lupinus luteus TaxID=3873 RepID=A0AAV1WSF9_LUPLU
MALPSSSPPPPTNVAFPFDNNNYIYDPASANFNDNSLPSNNPPAIPSQPRNANHPSYAEMIYTAIGALKEKNGSSKRAISKYMEQVYKDQLPPNHDALLTKNLKSLKKNGHLILVKKSYHLPVGSIQTHSAPEQAQQVAQSAQNANTSGGGVTEVKKRGRGRPPRASGLKAEVKPADARGGAVALVPSGSAVKPKPRGRPRKNAVTASSAAAATATRGGADKKLAVAGKKSRKKSSEEPVESPEEETNADDVEAEKKANNDILKRKIRYFQSKVGESVSVLGTYFNGESPITARAALRELENLANLDIDLPLREITIEEPYRPQQLRFPTQMQSIFDDPHA